MLRDSTIWYAEETFLTPAEVAAEMGECVADPHIRGQCLFQGSCGRLFPR